MKRCLFIVTVAFWAVSCNTHVEKPTTIDETYSPTDEELFTACADLQGIGPFIIGKTTFKETLKDKYFKNSSSFNRESNLYNGHWGTDFWKTKNDGVSNYFEKQKWIGKESRGNVKQLYAGEMTIGELKFRTFDMAFWKDTLVAIFFYPDDAIKDDVINHYKTKYGDGRGHYKYYDYQRRIGNELEATEKTDEVHLWANDKVALEYVKKEYFHMEPNKQPYGDYKPTLLIYSKNNYPLFEETLLSLSKQYDEQKESNIKSAMDAL